MQHRQIRQAALTSDSGRAGQAWCRNGGRGQLMAAAMISCACFWIAASWSGPRKDSA